MSPTRTRTQPRTGLDPVSRRIANIREEILSTHDPEALLGLLRQLPNEDPHAYIELEEVLLREAPALSNELIEEAVCTGTFRAPVALANNPCLTQEHAERMLGLAEESIREDRWTHPAPWAVLSALADSGRLASSHPLVLEIERIALGEEPGWTRQEAMGALVRISTLEPHRLKRLARTGRLRQFALVDAITHPNADVRVWRAIAEAMHDHPTVLEALAQIPDARRDPVVRERLRSAMGMEAVRVGFLLDGGATVRSEFLALARSAPWRAAALLDDPRFADVCRLQPEDLGVLLGNKAAGVRSAALQALGRCQGREPTQAEVALARADERAWREHISIALDFE